MVRTVVYVKKLFVAVVQELLLWGYNEKEPHVATWQVMWSERRSVLTDVSLPSRAKVSLTAFLPLSQVNSSFCCGNLIG